MGGGLSVVRARAALERQALPGVLAVLIVLPFADALVGQRLVAPNDGFQHYLPWHWVATQAWIAWEIPGWNPFSFSGYPLLASGQAGVLYPGFILFIVFPPVLANNLFVVGHLVVGGLGGYALARRAVGDGPAPLLTGIGFALSGFMIGHLGHQALVASAAWLPWGLYALTRLFERIAEGATNVAALIRPAFGAAVALALAGLAGHFQMYVISALSMGAYGGALALGKLRGPGLIHGIIWTVVAIIGSAGVAAAQLVPTAAILHMTQREAVGFEFAISNSFPASHLPLLLFPYLFGTSVPAGPFTQPYTGAWNVVEMSGYLGTSVVVAAAAGLTRSTRNARVMSMSLVGLFGCLVAVGASTPLGWVVYQLPILGQFRSWARYIILFNVAVLLVAGLGISRLRSADPQDRVRAAAWSAGAAGAILLVAIALPWVPSVRAYMPDGTFFQPAILIPVGMAVATGALAVGARAVPRVSWAIIPLIAIDLVLSFGWWHEWRTASPPPEAVHSRLQTAGTEWGGVINAPGGIDRYLYLGQDTARIGSDFVNATALSGIRSANGNDPLAPAGYTERLGGMQYYGLVEDPSAVWRADNWILDLLRVSTLLLDPDQPPPDNPQITGPRPVAEGRLHSYRYEARVPEAFLVGATVVDDTGEVPDPREVAAIGLPCPDCPQGPPGRAGEVLEVERGMTSIRLEVEVSRPAMLVVSESWFPGWKAYLGDDEVGVVRVHDVVMGVPIAEEGRHRLQLRYRPPWLGVGSAITALTLGAFGLTWAMARRRRPVSGQPSHESSVVG